MTRRSRLTKVSVVAALVALSTSACLSSSSGGSSGGGTASGNPSGSTVTIWTSVDQPVMDGLSAQVDSEAQAMGITVKWSRVDNINQLIMTKIQANDVPDIAMIPQPGVVKDIVTRGKATSLDNILDMSTLKASMIPGVLDAGTVDGKLYGVLVSANAKSFVWYPKKAWDAAGWKIPKSIPELNALTDQIRQSGKGAPWCLGIESGNATGWPATDWFEDLILRYGGVQQYNDWVSHKINFDSPLVRQAAAEFEKIAFTPGNVLGGRKSIASNAFGTAGNPMFNNPPKCWMYKMGSFITGADSGFFPKSVTDNIDSEVGVFAFPPATAGGDTPMLGGGDMAVLLKDSAGSEAVMKMLADKNVGLKAAGTSSFFSPHKDFDVSLYKGSLAQDWAKIAYGSSSFNFDGSDAMPGAVGSGSFWKQMTAWISGQENLDTALKNIDASWPSS